MTEISQPFSGPDNNPDVPFFYRNEAYRLSCAQIFCPDTTTLADWIATKSASWPVGLLIRVPSDPPSTFREWNGSTCSIVNDRGYLDGRIGAAGGVAPLDSGTPPKLPMDYMPTALLGGLSYQGAWDAATNTPTISGTGTAGHYYIVGNPGSTNIGGITSWSAWDAVVSNGTAWERIPASVVALLGAYTATLLNNRQGWRGMHRNGLSGFAWGIVDKLKKLGLGLAHDGALHAHRLQMIGGSPRRNSLPFVWYVRDSAGRAAIGVKPGGTLNLAGEDYIKPSVLESQAIAAAIDTLSALEAGAGRATGSPYIWAIRDSLGAIAFAIKFGGEIFAKLDRKSTTLANNTSYTPPSTFGSTVEAFNIREFPDCWRALTVDMAGFTLPVKRLKSPGANTVDLIERTAPMLFCPYLGQSNAGNYQSSPYAGSYQVAAFPHSAAQFLSGLSITDDTALSGGNILDEESLTGIIPLRDGYGQYIQTTASLALEDVARQAGAPTPGTITATYWWSGRPITSFVRDTNGWNTIMKYARKAKARAADYGRAAQCKWLLFVQGENSTTGYKDALVAFATDIRVELKTQMGQSFLPEFLYVQINSYETETVASGIEQAQLDAYLENIGAGMTLVGPMYHCPLGDNIHITSIGRMVLGENIAIAQQHVLAGKQFKPLYPVSATLSGNHIDIVFNVPGNRLEFDADWILPAVANQGFQYSDDSSSATISSVAILSRDTVRVTLSGTPTGTNKKIRYAVLTETNVDGWGNGRGQLYSPSNVKSFYWRKGYNVPEYTRHYSVRFTMEL
jgi:hypothetical protein